MDVSSAHDGSVVLKMGSQYSDVRPEERETWDRGSGEGGGGEGGGGGGGGEGVGEGRGGSTRRPGAAEATWRARAPNKPLTC